MIYKGLCTIAFAALVSVASVAPLSAAAVTFNTSGLLTSGATTNSSITFGSGANTATIAFTGLTAQNATPGATATNIAEGSFGVTYTGTGATLPTGVTFTFTLTQTTPSVPAITFSATLNAGTIAQGNDTVTVTYAAPLGKTAGTSFYTVPNTVPLPQPLVAGTQVSTTQTGTVVLASAVPEPGTLTMLGSALMGLGFLSFRRKKQ